MVFKSSTVQNATVQLASLREVLYTRNKTTKCLMAAESSIFSLIDSFPQTQIATTGAKIHPTQVAWA